MKLFWLPTLLLYAGCITGGGGNGGSLPDDTITFGLNGKKVSGYARFGLSIDSDDYKMLDAEFEWSGEPGSLHLYFPADLMGACAEEDECSAWLYDPTHDCRTESLEVTLTQNADDHVEGTFSGTFTCETGKTTTLANGKFKASIWF